MRELNRARQNTLLSLKAVDRARIEELEDAVRLREATITELRRALRTLCSRVIMFDFVRRMPLPPDVQDAMRRFL